MKRGSVAVIGQSVARKQSVADIRESVAQSETTVARQPPSVAVTSQSIAQKTQSVARILLLTVRFPSCRYISLPCYLFLDTYFDVVIYTPLPEFLHRQDIF